MVSVDTEQQRCRVSAVNTLWRATGDASNKFRVFLSVNVQNEGEVCVQAARDMMRSTHLDLLPGFDMPI